MPAPKNIGRWPFLSLYPPTPFLLYRCVARVAQLAGAWAEGARADTAPTTPDTATPNTALHTALPSTETTAAHTAAAVSDAPGAARDANLVFGLVTAGGVAGFATAFRAPVGALIYVMEEVATPEHWRNETTGLACVAAACGTLVITSLIRVLEGTGAIHFSSIIIYSADTSLTDLGWKYGDAPGFIVVAMLGGAMAGGVTKAGLALNSYRQTAAWRKPALAKIAEVAAVAAFTTAVFCALPAVVGKCYAVDEHGDDDAHTDDLSSVDDDHRRRLSGSAARRFVEYGCGDQQYNRIAGLSLVGEEGAIRHLLARDGVEAFTPWTLAVFLAVYAPCVVLAFGLAVPAGTFVPLMLLGAGVGRVVGEGLHVLTSANNGWALDVSAPGVYAALGVAAALGGFTRCTISIVVVLAEISGDLSLIIPTMFAVVLARAVAAAVSHDSYTHGLLHLAQTHGRQSNDKAHAFEATGSHAGVQGL